MSIKESRPRKAHLVMAVQPAKVAPEKVEPKRSAIEEMYAKVDEALAKLKGSK